MEPSVGSFVGPPFLKGIQKWGVSSQRYVDDCGATDEEPHAAYPVFHVHLHGFLGKMARRPLISSGARGGRL